MAYNAATGVYTPASGATTATAGQVIASATWNGIFNDITTALTTLGKADLMGLNSGINSAAFAPVALAVNFAASASDIATFAIPVPASLPGYSVRALYIGNAGATLNSTTITLYTGAGATGTTVIGSTATTVTSSLANTSNSLQVIVPASANTVVFKASILYLHVSTSTSTSSTADVMLQITPIY